MEALILDASVLSGLLDTADTHHKRAINEVEAADREDGSSCCPASAYSETLVAFARARRLEEARWAITAMGITIVSLTDTIAERAAELRARHPVYGCLTQSSLPPRRKWVGACDRRLSQLAGKLA